MFFFATGFLDGEAKKTERRAALSGAPAFFYGRSRARSIRRIWLRRIWFCRNAAAVAKHRADSAADN